MGLFGPKKSESMAASEFLAMSNDEIDLILKKAKKGGVKLPYKSAKEIRKAAQEDRRKLEGERGFGAILDGLKGGGTNNQNFKNNVNPRDKVHPSLVRGQVAREIQAAIRSGDRAAQIRLREEAIKRGFIKP